jgi:multicomponent Na+:H+ antiporter subunit D
VGIVSLASLTVARYMIADRDHRFDFINLLIIASIGMSGIAMVRDIFSMYVFIEVTAVASFIMIASRRNASALEGAFKYIMLSFIASAMMLAAVALLILISGNTSFTALHRAISAAPTSLAASLATGLFICGLLIKGGIVPFHGWLPDAYSAAPAPASVLLAGILTKASGVYTLIRITVSVFGFSSPLEKVLLFAGAASVLTGAFAALVQEDFKRMLSYSSISQIGYIVMGLGAGTELGVLGAIFHFFNHAVFKTLLFVNSAAVEDKTGTVDMSRMGGLSSRMPVTGATSVMGFLSTAGVPPLAGFWSKLMIIIALWLSGHRIYAAIAIMAGVITLGYLLMMQRRVFFGEVAQGMEAVKEAHPGFQIAASALAFLCIATGVFFPLIYLKIILPAKEIFLH